MTTSPERRRHPRYRLEPALTGVVAQVEREGRLVLFDGHAYDIAEGGARIELDEPLPDGEQVALCLTLPGESRPILVSARVARVFDVEDDPGPRRMGVAFGRFTHSDDRRRLHRFLADGGGRLAA